ncbi:hypothetical protein AVEN_239590-1 [Araneus ventricosus]|uniref:Uncharacterized protein n=1 Tax=Araneus ventricosus TaxID=182803 RepID=A0A4Y1ZUD2_ARAVE|nr:hypothetical protein AVEN_239590-1 [Araneus ventricosus]
MVRVSAILVIIPQKIVVARGFVGWLERSGKMSVNARLSKEASRRTEMGFYRLCMRRGDSTSGRIQMGCYRLCMRRGDSTSGRIQMGCYRLCMRRGDSTSGRIQSGNKSSTTQVDRRKTDSGNRALVILLAMTGQPCRIQTFLNSLLPRSLQRI